MRSESEAIRRVIDAFEKSDWSEIDVRVGPVRVHLRTGDPTDSGPTPDSVRSGDDSAVDARRTGVRPEPGPDNSPSVPPSSAATPVDVAADAFVVRSPSPGIFWRSPQPGAPPFADVGQHVDVASTLCIVEVMKLMNHVKGGVVGTVVAVFGRDGVAVDKGEALFAIDTAVGAA